MELETKQRISETFRSFRLPRYHEIPNVGLYLEQCAKYISEYLSCLEESCLTPSMISNYVKKGLIDNPVKKQYGRDQIAYLFFIAIAKSVLSLDGLTNFLALQKRTYPLERAYDFFCEQFEQVLFFTTEVQDSIDMPVESSSDEKRLLFSCIVAVTQKIYLEKCLDAISREETAGSD